MKVATTSFLLVAGAWVLGGCSDGTSSLDSDLCSSFSSFFVAKDDAGTERGSFAAGERITFEMRITNASDSQKTLHNADACPQVEIAVENSLGQDVWRSSDGIACAQVVTDITYGPGQSGAFSFEWGQVQRSGGNAPAGPYTAFATERTECGSALSKALAFTIQ